MSKRAKIAARTYKEGKSRAPYRLRSNIATGIQEDEDTVLEDQVCKSCVCSLKDLNEIYKSFLHTGSDLKRCKAIYTKPRCTPYYNIKQQNEFLLKTVFDAKGNYIYHRNCIRVVFGVGSQRLARLRKAILTERSQPFVRLRREDVRIISDLVLPQTYDGPATPWLQSQPSGTDILCQSKPARHGHVGKRSNHAKDERVLHMFLDFVDNNSAPNGRKEGSHGKTYYFNPKFSMIRSPNKSDPQFAFKCRHSVLHEFNSSLKVWEESQLVHSIHGYNSIVLTLEYVLIVQYCDTCKDYNEEISRARQTINRLRQSGHSSEVSIHTQEDLISKYTTLLQYHKNEAQNGLEYYNKLANETKFCYQRILKNATTIHMLPSSNNARRLYSIHQC